MPWSDGDAITSSNLNTKFGAAASYNVTDSTYGAVGDNSTDDLAAFQAAYTALPSTGGEIVIPSSVTGYRLTSTWTISKDNVVIRGAGGAQDDSNSPTPVAPLKFDLDNGENGIVITSDNVTIQGLGLQATGNSSGVGIHSASAAKYLKIRDVVVDSFDSHGIQDEDGEKDLIEDVIVIDCGGHGVYMNSFANSLGINNTLRRVRAYRNGALGVGRNIYALKEDLLLIEQCQTAFSGHSSHIEVDRCTSPTIINADVERSALSGHVGIEVDWCYNACLINPRGFDLDTLVKVTGQAGGSKDAQGTVIIGPAADDGTNWGIEVGSLAEDTLIMGMSATGMSATTALNDSGDNTVVLGWNARPSSNSWVALNQGISVASTGVAVRPAYAFSSEASLGWYRSAASSMNLSYGDLYLPNTLEVGNATPGDDFTLLRFVTSRGWRFETDGADGGTQCLALRTDNDGTDKQFKILSQDGTASYTFSAQNSAISNQFTVNRGDLAISQGKLSISTDVTPLSLQTATNFNDMALGDLRLVFAASGMSLCYSSGDTLYVIGASADSEVQPTT